jgi:predicted RNA-binding protein associated with RNAse of E/G family
MDRWNVGDAIMLREVYLGRTWALRPVRVVEDTDQRVVVFHAPGTIWKRPVGPSHEPLRLQQPDWTLAETEWTGNAALRIFDEQRPHSVLLWWEPKTWEFQGWYINLEQPMRRTSQGFEYLDHVLDIVVAPDRAWHWKDQDEIALALDRGLLTAAEAEAIRCEGERVIANLEARVRPFDEEWITWRPPQHWLPPALPERGVTALTRSD